MTDLHRLRFVAVADVYKAGRLAGRLARTGDAGTAFTYDQGYLAAGHPPVAVNLPLTGDPVTVPSGGVPPFFAGLLPEGHRLTVLRNAVKTSLDDELSLLLANGADAPGDVQVVHLGEAPVEPEPLVENEAVHLAAAKGLRIPVAEETVVTDHHGRPGPPSPRRSGCLNARPWPPMPWPCGQPWSWTSKRCRSKALR